MSIVKAPINNVRFNNIARYIGLKHGLDWYEWVVYVDEEDNILNQIDSIEYLLHQSFPNPKRKKTNSKQHFALNSSGWGGFNIKIKIFFKNGSTLETAYYLDLSKPWDYIFGY